MPSSTSYLVFLMDTCSEHKVSITWSSQSNTSAVRRISVCCRRAKPGLSLDEVKFVAEPEEYEVEFLELLEHEVYEGYLAFDLSLFGLFVFLPW